MSLPQMFSSRHAVLVPTIASGYPCLSSEPSTHRIRRVRADYPNSSTPNLQVPCLLHFPHLKFTGPERIVFRHVFTNTPQRICQILVRVCPTDSWVEVLDVDEGVIFVSEGTEAGNRLVRIGTEYLGKAFDDGHEDVFAGDGRCLMPKVYCQLGIDDVVASYEKGAGCGMSGLFNWVCGIQSWRLTRWEIYDLLS